ncbi:SIR2-like domain-containing protein [Microbacterium hydrothermale]|nr:SIR2-like domain-containing protein [Microbacterium hydrothermale]
MSAESLLTGHALSYEHQPHFRRLVETMRTAPRPLVIVAGAGLSMAAGLPSWRTLIDRLEERLVPPDLAKPFRTLNSDALERRTDTILHLTGDTSIAARNHRHLREALYGDSLPRESTAPATSLAQLVATYPQPVFLITTNFDEILDKAVEDVLGEVSSYSFDTWEEWAEIDPEKRRSSVMHLHGLEYPDDRAPLGPLVLSESDFRASGAEIQAALGRLVRGCDVIVIGASLTDQNIVIPLSSARPDDGSRFLISTPVLEHESVTERDCARVAVWQAEALEASIGVTPILLKSYSQVAQVITECVLSAASPGEYVTPRRGVPRNRSLHYGTRMRAAVEGAYESLGASSKDGSMKQWDAIALSHELNELTVGPDGPDQLLRDLRRRHRGECAEDENLGLFIWLRDLPQRPGARYSLRLMVSSAYAHWKTWSAFRVEPIAAGTKNAAAQAAYAGVPVFAEIPRVAHTSSWQGAWAQPITAACTSSDLLIGDYPADKVQVGALAVNTDRKITEQGHEGAGDVSALAVLTREEMDLFIGSVHGVLHSIFQG